MTNYREYLMFNGGSYAKNQEQIMDKIEIEHRDKKKIMDIKKLDLIVFAEPYCPDCRALVAILEKFVSLNEKINIKYIDRENNSSLLASYDKEAKIPTIVIDGKVRFVEYPFSFKMMLDDKSIDKERAIYEYRTGKYNKNIVESLINILKSAALNR